MANSQSNLFHFFQRYKWRAQDFEAVQTAFLEASRGLGEGLFSGSVLDGMGVSATAGNMHVDVAEGIAVGPSGYLNVTDEVTDLTLVAPSSYPTKNLIVVRPLLEDNTLITKPTDPFSTVYLNQYQKSEITVVYGSESNTPEYPSKGANDVVLAGVKLTVGQTSISANDLDFEVRDLPGRQGGYLSQHVMRYDNRLRPYRNTYKSLGIKPSQTFGPDSPQLFLYTGKRPSTFPLTSGVFTASDTFLDFSSGAITGGDGDSSDFTPTVPTAGNSIVATVCLNPSTDLLTVQYGTQGTFAQCLTGIKNMVTSGAGCVSLPKNLYKIAFVIVTSISGAISDLTVFDCRSLGGLASGGTLLTKTGNYTLLDSDDVVVFDCTGGNLTATLPAPSKDARYTIKKWDSGTNSLTIARHGSEKIDGTAADISTTAQEAFTLMSDGTDWYIV